MPNPTPTISSDLLKDIIARNEVGNRANAYKLSHAGVANSGYSVGVFQLDLAHQTGARDTVEDFLSGRGAFSRTDMASIRSGFARERNAKPIAAPLQAAINEQFQTQAGRAVIDALDAGQLEALMFYIGQAMGDAQANPRYPSDAAFRAFSESDLFQALMGDNVNQYGPPNTFGRYIQGQTVTVGGDSLTLGNGDWNFQAFASYEAHYSYVRNSQQGADDMCRRRTNVITVLDNHSALGNEDKATCLGIIQDTYTYVG